MSKPRPKQSSRSHTKRRSSGRRRKRNQNKSWIWALILIMLIGAGVLLMVAKDMTTPDTSTDVPPVDNPTSTTQTQPAASTTQPPTQPVTSAAPQTTTAATSPTTTKPATTNAHYQPNTEGRYIQKGNPPWQLRLVNPWNSLPTSFFDTVPLKQYATGKQFDERAIQALKDMIQAGKPYGLYAVSLYRDYALQTKLYNNEVQKQLKKGVSQAKAEELAATVVARPGTSEHHTGLAADILGSGYSDLIQSFGTSEAGKWLRENCAEYGFILRYPKEKEEITGVIYEPWHFRYVGKEHAQEIMRRGLTLEEYLEEKGW